MPNTLFLLVLALLLFDYALERFLNYLNLRNLSSEIPKELTGIYEEEKYRKSQEYEKAKTKFSFYSSTFSLALMLVMLFSGGFAYVDNTVQQFVSHPIPVALLFFGVLFLAADILGLPFAIYHTFVLEEKFDFNRTTVKTFILDKLKGYLLGGIIGGLLLSGFVWFYEYAGKEFWLYAWVAISGFSVFMAMFASSLILPLFNKLTPLPAGELRSAIEEYCSKVNFKLDNLFVMDGSKRSAKSNAFFTGIGSKKKIVLFDTLINTQTTGEIVAVLAHEVGHYKKKHVPVTMIFSVLQTGIMLYLLSWVIGNPALSQVMGSDQSNFRLGLLCFGLLYSPVSMLLGVFMSILSRKFEYQADRYAAETYSTSSMIDALKKISVHNLGNLTPHPLYVFFHHSHPTLLQRLKGLERVTRA